MTDTSHTPKCGTISARLHSEALYRLTASTPLYRWLQQFAPDEAINRTLVDYQIGLLADGRVVAPYLSTSGRLQHAIAIDLIEEWPLDSKGCVLHRSDDLTVPAEPAFFGSHLLARAVGCPVVVVGTPLEALLLSTIGLCVAEELAVVLALPTLAGSDHNDHCRTLRQALPQLRGRDITAIESGADTTLPDFLLPPTPMSALDAAVASPAGHRLHSYVHYATDLSLQPHCLTDEALNRITHREVWRRGER